MVRVERLNDFYSPIPGGYFSNLTNELASKGYPGRADGTRLSVSCALLFMKLVGLARGLDRPDGPRFLSDRTVHKRSRTVGPRSVVLFDRKTVQMVRERQLF